MIGMIGQPYSSSRSCGIIRFVGGPYDGKSGLYDHSDFYSIQFSHGDERCTHVYKQDLTISRWHYRYQGPSHWGRDEFREHFWWCYDQSSPTV